jgi:Arc/MetJ-type ribon-helix-helix transcriptional regulator
MVIHSETMAERAISVRLDPQALKALDELMAGGRSQSQAIRDALLLATDREWRARAQQEWAEMMADPAEQALLKEIRRDFFGEG